VVYNLRSHCSHPNSPEIETGCALKLLHLSFQRHHANWPCALALHGSTMEPNIDYVISTTPCCRQTKRPPASIHGISKYFTGCSPLLESWVMSSFFISSFRGWISAAFKWNDYLTAVCALLQRKLERSSTAKT